MKNPRLQFLIKGFMVIAFMWITLCISAQETGLKSYQDTKQEIESMFGFFPLITKAYPADEIKEAIAQGANTRHWSMILQGNNVDFEAFKKEVQMMLKKMSETEAK